MDSRSDFIVQLLEKLGTPLMRAVNAHASSGGEPAQVIAALMTETVKMSVGLSQAMNLKPADGNGDAIRVALAAQAGALVADFYEQNGRIPSETDTRRMGQSLESLLAFADNFAPAAEHTSRLQSLSVKGAAPFFDAMQADLYAMNAMVPVISAIAEFPFGQPEAKLAQDIAARLAEESKSLRTNLAGIAEGGEAKCAELILLQSLAQIYASVHRAETARLKTQTETGSASIEPVWAAFDRQLAMLEALLGASAGISGGGRGGKGVKPAAEAPAEEAPAAVAPPAQEAPPADAAQSAKNPMSFFKKPGA